MTMRGFQTIPSMEKLQHVAEVMPSYMHPNTMPYAVLSIAHLSREQCEKIVTDTSVVETYGFHGCNAHTRECVRPLSDCLRPIMDVLLFANEYFFKFDIDTSEPAAWLQSYSAGQDYDDHIDGSPGQSRKLTAVAMLSDESTYSGGHLVMDVGQSKVTVPREQGTIVVFPSWVTHRVTLLEDGYRQTINLGAWGPPFK